MSEVPIQLIVAAFKDEKAAKEALIALESEEGFTAGLAATPEEEKEAKDKPAADALAPEA